MSALPQEMRAGLAQVDAFSVTGLSIITDHTKATEDINALWESFFEQSVGQNLPGKTDDIIYAVYSDYEGDHEKPYRFTIGYRTNTNDNTPPGMHTAYVPAQDVAVLSATGQQPKALFEAWEAIWSSDLERTYTADFEIYGPRFFEEGIHEVLINVGIKT